MAGIFGLFGRVSPSAQSVSLVGRDRSLPVAATRKIDTMGRRVVATFELSTTLGGAAVGTSPNRFSEHPGDAGGQIRPG
jgi:hypothetical protein